MTIFQVVFLELLVLAGSKTYFYFGHIQDGTITIKGELLLGMIYFLTILFGWLWFATSRGRNGTSIKEFVLKVSSARIIRKMIWSLVAALVILISLYSFESSLVYFFLDDQIDSLATLFAVSVELGLVMEFHNSLGFREKIGSFISLPRLKEAIIQILRICPVQFMLFQLLLNPKIRSEYQYELTLLVIISIAFQLYFLAKELNWNPIRIISLARDDIRKNEIIWVILLFLAYSAAKILFISPHSYLMMAPTDGHQYWQMANLFFQGRPDIQAYHHYPPLYSLVISPAFLFPKADTLMVISIINAILSSSAIFPIYFLSRRLLPGSLPVLFALISIAHPDHFLFPSHPSSENLYYPIFFWTFYLITTPAKEIKFELPVNIITGVFIGLCYLTRYQTFPLIPVFLLIWWIKPQVNNQNTLDWLPNRRKIGQFLIVALFFLVTYSFWLVPGILQGVSLRDLLGFSVEGKNSLLSFDRPASSLLFWGVLAIGHIVLVVAPLIAVLLTVLRKINKITLDAKMSHWLIAFGLIGSALFVIVVRHAWLASYNLNEPTRLVTRYFIYFAVPSWLTIVALAKYLNRKDMVPLIISTIVSTCLVYASYELFFNQNWILLKRILYIDAYLPFYAQKIFLLTVIGGSVLSILFVWKKKTQQIPIVLLFCILYINLASLLQYRNYFMDYQRGGRFLNEYIARGIIKEGMEPVEGTKFILTTAETITHPEMQLTVRGLDSSDFDTTIKAKLMDYPKGTLMVLETIPGEKYLIIKSTGELDGVDKISEFSFSGTDYELVKEN